MTAALKAAAVEKYGAGLLAFAVGPVQPFIELNPVGARPVVRKYDSLVVGVSGNAAHY